MNFLERLMQIAYFAAFAVMFYFLHPAIVDLIDALFVGLAGIGIGDGASFEFSNFLVVVIVALVAWLIKSPIGRRA